jgi:hypothetical protein
MCNKQNPLEPIYTYPIDDPLERSFLLRLRSSAHRTDIKRSILFAPASVTARAMHMGGRSNIHLVPPKQCPWVVQCDFGHIKALYVFLKKFFKCLISDLDRVDNF